MAVNLTELVENIKRDLAAVQQAINGQLTLVTVFFSGNTSVGGSVTLFALDALGGSIKDIKVNFFLDDEAAATFTPTWHKTRAADLITFTQEAIPAIAAIALPAADRVYRYDLGDLAEGLQGEFRLAQDGLGGANPYDGFVTCLMEV